MHRVLTSKEGPKPASVIGLLELMRIRVSNVSGGLSGPEIARLQVGHLWRSGAVRRKGVTAPVNIWTRVTFRLDSSHRIRQKMTYAGL